MKAGRDPQFHSGLGEPWAVSVKLFFEDAQKAAPVLGITLTRRRQNDSVDAPMCVVPHHAFDGYLGKLLDAGFKVAVAEQVEDPSKAKGLVRR